MQAAGKKPSTIRNAYFLVRQVLGSGGRGGAAGQPSRLRQAAHRAQHR